MTRHWMTINLRLPGCSEVPVILLLTLLVCLVSEVVGQTICREGYGYPYWCPDPAFPRCCRYYMEPTCCEHRAKKACVRSKHKKYSTTGDPDPDHAAVWCPRPGQSSDHTVCSYNNSKISCMSTKTLGAILGGVFGGLLLIGLIITATCCYMVKSGRWVCVKIRPGKWTIMGRQRAAAFRQQQSGMAMRAGNNPQVAPPTGAGTPRGTGTVVYPPTGPPSYASLDQPQAKYIAGPNPASPPPSYAASTQDGANSRTQYWNPERTC